MTFWETAGAVFLGLFIGLVTGNGLMFFFLQKWVETEQEKSLKTFQGELDKRLFSFEKLHEARFQALPELFHVADRLAWSITSLLFETIAHMWYEDYVFDDKYLRAVAENLAELRSSFDEHKLMIDLDLRRDYSQILDWGHTIFLGITSGEVTDPDSGEKMSDLEEVVKVCSLIYNTSLRPALDLIEQRSRIVLGVSDPG